MHQQNQCLHPSALFENIHKCASWFSEGLSYCAIAFAMYTRFIWLTRRQRPPTKREIGRFRNEMGRQWKKRIEITKSTAVSVITECNFPFALNSCSICTNLLCANSNMLSLGFIFLQWIQFRFALFFLFRSIFFATIFASVFECWLWKVYPRMRGYRISFYTVLRWIQIWLWYAWV